MLQTLQRALFLKDLVGATAVLDSLRIDPGRLRAAFRSNVSPLVREQIVTLQSNAETAYEMINSRRYNNEPVKIGVATTEQLQSQAGAAARGFPIEVRHAAVEVLLPGVTFYQAEIPTTGEVLLPGVTFSQAEIPATGEGAHRLHLLYWDGNRWAMLGPVWECLDVPDSPAWGVKDTAAERSQAVSP